MPILGSKNVDKVILGLGIVILMVAFGWVVWWREGISQRTGDNQVAQIVRASVQSQESYRMQVIKTEDESLMYVMDRDKHGNIWVSDRTATQAAEYILSSDDRLYYRYQDRWLKLVIGKITPVIELVKQNDILAWDLNQVGQASLEPTSLACPVELMDQNCGVYALQFGSNGAMLWLDRESDRLLGIGVSRDDMSYQLKYDYQPVRLALPEEYEDYIIPDRPTEEDLVIITHIYGAN